MTKARLIKKQEIVERKQLVKAKGRPRKVVGKTVDVVVDWLESRRDQRQDPRKAFDALFIQPQTQ